MRPRFRPLSAGVRIAVVTSIAVFLCLPARAAHAQTTATTAADPAAPLSVTSVDSSAYPTIHVVVAAPRRLAGSETLPPEAFRVTENGRARPTKASRLPNDKLEIVLAIDTSGSMRGSAIDAAKVAANTFVSQMPAGSRIAVVGFGSQPTVVSPFGASSADRTNAINALQADGDTALYDALMASDSLFTPSTRDAHRFVVLLSDGGDTKSVNSIDTATSRLTVDGVQVYAVALLTSESDLPALTRVATSTSGRVVAANSATALNDLYDSIAAELSNQYDVTYSAKSRGTSDVQLTLDHADVRARAAFTLDLEQAAARVPEPVRVSPPVATPGPGLFERPWTVALGGAAIFAALALVLVPLLQPRSRRRRLAAEAGRAPDDTMKARVAGLTEHASELAERALERRGRHRSLADALERSGITLRPGEWVVAMSAAGFGALLLGLALGGLLVAVALVAATIVGFQMTVSVRTGRRRRAFSEQLGDTLQLLASNLRAGHSLLQSVDAVGQESDSPTCDEFRRLLFETRLGRPLTEALDSMAKRVGSEDFAWVVQAIEIHREVGGDLAELLDNVSATIRDRNRVRRQVDALSAEGRLSALILFLLPFGMLLLIRLRNPGYLGELTGSTAGQLMLAAGAALLVVGGVWLRRLCRIVY